MIETALLPHETEAPASLPRLGFAGAGWIGRHRLEAIARAGCADITAIYDPEPAAVGAVRQCAPVALQAQSFEELLDLPLDGIVIATPSALHATQAAAALRSGKAVFCQKPLARTAAETATVIAAARAADRLLGVDLSYRGHTGTRRIRELIARGELGRVYAVEGVFHNAYGPDKPWFYDARQSGGGCLLDLGIHLLDLVLWSLDFAAVQGAAGQLLAGGAPWRPGQTTVEDYAAAQLELDGGTSVQLACSWKAPAGCDARIRLTFFGDRGGAEFANVNGSFYEFSAHHFLPDRSRRVLAEGAENWGAQAAIEWSRRLAVNPGYDPEVERLTAVAEIIDRIYGRSA